MQSLEALPAETQNKNQGEQPPAIWAPPESFAISWFGSSAAMEGSSPA